MLQTPTDRANSSSPAVAGPVYSSLFSVYFIDGGGFQRRPIVPQGINCQKLNRSYAAQEANLHVATISILPLFYHALSQKKIAMFGDVVVVAMH